MKEEPEEEVNSEDEVFTPSLAPGANKPQRQVTIMSSRQPIPRAELCIFIFAGDVAKIIIFNFQVGAKKGEMPDWAKKFLTKTQHTMTAKTPER